MKLKLSFALLFVIQLFFSQKTIVEYQKTSNYGGTTDKKDYYLIDMPDMSMTVFSENNNYNFKDDECLMNSKSGFNSLISCKENILKEYKDLNYDKRKWGWVTDPMGYEWKITKEKKEILGYKCYKATTKFRGRQWTVYFTYDIPISSGPWKLRGLPGLILEANESEGIFSFNAIRIIQNSNIKVPDGLTKIFDYYKDKQIAYDDYLKVMDGFQEKIKSQLIAQVPQGTKYNLNNNAFRNSEIEKSYEWEKPEK